MDRPDLRGRLDILKVQTRSKPLSNKMNLEVLARRTPGFEGADLSNVVNEAAILAARQNKTCMRDARHGRSGGTYSGRAGA